MSSAPPRVLTIAGSDSGGGAGIQADLKAFARCGAHGMTAITAITAQNTVAVTGVYPVAPEAIVEQVRAVAEDIGVDAVKIGMLGNVETIDAVDRALDLVGDVPVVLDPVMVAESGARLLDEDAEEALRTELVPRATVVTPNLAEARVLAAPETTLRPRRSRGPSTRSGPPRWSSPAVTATRPSTSSSTGSGWWSCRASATRAARRTARAARTPRRSRRTWPAVPIRSRRPSRRSGSPRKP